MTNEQNKILVLTNDTELEKAPLFAAMMAGELDAELTICHVVDMEEGLINERIVYLPEVSAHGGKILGDRISLSHTLISKMKESLIVEGKKIILEVMNTICEFDIEIKAVVLTGKPAEEIAIFAKENNFDLIITGKSKRNLLSRIIWKTIPEKIKKKVPCPIIYG